MRYTTCLEFNLIMVDVIAALLNCTSVVQATVQLSSLVKS